jgi:uncharacterized protein YecE (DUF72 family)
MIYVACSGFPVPVSRYFETFNAVEISETELAVPGAGTRRRWLREAPRGSAFSVLAPKKIAESAFEPSRENREALVEVCKFAKMIKARALVFAAEPGFKPNRPNRGKVRKFFESLPDGLPQPVLDLPDWTIEQTETALKNAKINIAYDPLAEQPPQPGPLAYLRMPGPSGYRSRYDDESIDRIVQYCKQSGARDTLCVFCNIDRFVNARRALAELD